MRKGEWIRGETAWGGFPAAPTAASGGWKGKTFTMKLCFYETPFIVTNRFTVEEDTVTFESESNVGFGPTKFPSLKGTATK